MNINFLNFKTSIKAVKFNQFFKQAVRELIKAFID